MVPRSEQARGGRILKKGFKKVLFFSIVFCIVFGMDLGSFFGQFFKIFNVFWHWLSGYVFHVIMLVLGPVYVPLDVPK